MKYVPNHHLDCPVFTAPSTKRSLQIAQTLPPYQRYERLSPQMSNFSFGNNYNNTYVPPMRNPIQNYYNNARAFNTPRAQPQNTNRSLNTSQGYSFREEIELMDIKLKCDLLSHKLSKLNNIILPSSANTDVKRFRTRNYNFGNIVQRNGRFCITDKNGNRDVSRGKSVDHEDLSDIADDIVNTFELNGEEEKEDDGKHMKKSSVCSEKKFIEDECIEIGGIEERETVEEIVKSKGALKGRKRILKKNINNEEGNNNIEQEEVNNDNNEKKDIEIVNDNNIDKEQEKNDIEEKKEINEENKEEEEKKEENNQENTENNEEKKEEEKKDEEPKSEEEEKNDEEKKVEENKDVNVEEKKGDTESNQNKDNYNAEKDNQPNEEEKNESNPKTEEKEGVYGNGIKLDLTKATNPSEEQKSNQEDEDPANPGHHKLNTDEQDDMIINQIIQNSKPTEDNVTPLVTPRDNLKEDIKNDMETPTTQKKKKNVTFNDPALIKIEYSQDDLIYKLDVIDSENNHLRFRPKNINRYLTLLASDTQPKPCILNSSNSKLLYSYGKSSNKKPLILNSKNMIKKNIEMIQEIAKRGSIWKIQNQKKAKRVPQHNCRKFVQNPQKFFTEDLCETVLKSYDLKVNSSDKPRHVGRSVSPKKINYFNPNESKKKKENSLVHSEGTQSEEMHNFKLMVDRVQIRPIEEENSEDSNNQSASKRKHSF